MESLTTHASRTPDTRPFTVKGYRWIDDLPPQASRFCGALESGLQEAFSEMPAILPLEHTYRLLERFCYWPSLMEKRGGWAGVDQQVYGRAAAKECAIALSDLDCLKKVAALVPGDIRRVVDLGSGYWSYSVAMEAAFPRLELAVGIESDPAKAEACRTTTFPCYKLGSQFRMKQANMGDVEAAAGESAGGVPYDLCLLKNPQTFIGKEAYQDMLKRIGGCLAPMGTFAAIIDEHRMCTDGNPDLMKALEALGIKPRVQPCSRFPAIAGHFTQLHAAIFWVTGAELQKVMP